jgi:hypothetical protein
MNQLDSRHITLIQHKENISMSPFAKLPCWVIMNCAEDKKCPAKLYPNENCWEIFAEMDSSSFNVCQDCIVYITRQEDAALSPKEVEQVMLKKGIALSVSGNRIEKTDS